MAVAERASLRFECFREVFLAAHAHFLLLEQVRKRFCVLDASGLRSEAALCAPGEAVFRSLVFSFGVTQTSAVENSFHKEELSAAHGTGLGQELRDVRDRLRSPVI
jgi:hypothetical protein